MQTTGGKKLLSNKRARGRDPKAEELFKSELSPIPVLPSPEAPMPTLAAEKWPRAPRRRRIDSEVEEDKGLAAPAVKEDALKVGIVSSAGVLMAARAKKAAGRWPTASTAKGNLEVEAVPANLPAAIRAKVSEFRPTAKASTAMGRKGELEMEVVPSSKAAIADPWPRAPEPVIKKPVTSKLATESVKGLRK